MKQIDVFTLLKKYELLIASGTVILFVFFLSFLFLLPNLQKAQEISSHKKELVVKLSQLTAKEKMLTSLSDTFYNQTFPKIGQVLPQSRDYLSLFSRFDSLQEKTGVSIVRTDFQLGLVSTTSAKLAQGSHAIPLAMSFEVLGTPTQIQKFLESLRDLTGRFISVEDMQVIFGEDGIIKANFNGHAYFYLLPKSIGSLDSPLPILDKEQETLLTTISKNQPSVTEESVETDSVGKKDLFR